MSLRETGRYVTENRSGLQDKRSNMPLRRTCTTRCSIGSFLARLFVVVFLALCVQQAAADSDVSGMHGGESSAASVKVQTNKPTDPSGDVKTYAQYVTQLYQNSGRLATARELYEPSYLGRVQPSITGPQAIHRGFNTYGQKMRSIDESVRNMNTNINRINTLGRQFRR